MERLFESFGDLVELVMCEKLFNGKRFVPTRRMLEVIFGQCKILLRPLIFVDECCVYSFGVGKWGEYPRPRYMRSRNGHRVAMMGDGLLMISGGSDAQQKVLSATFMLDPFDARKRPIECQMDQERQYHAMVVLNDNRVMVCGGCVYHKESDTFKVIDTIEFYSPITREWELSKHKLLRGRMRHSAVVLSDGDVLISGGLCTMSADSVTRSCFRYNPTTGECPNVANLFRAIYDHDSVLLPNGNVAVMGGVAGREMDATCLIYHPVEDEWKITTNMNHGAARHRSAYVPSINSVAVIPPLTTHDVMLAMFVEAKSTYFEMFSLDTFKWTDGPCVIDKAHGDMGKQKI